MATLLFFLLGLWSHSALGQVCSSTCSEGAVRLADGRNSTEGRVELCRNNEWGTVCDSSWDAADARVVCRQLGFPYDNATALGGATFGRGRGVIHIGSISCLGCEPNLLTCLFTSRNCDHDQDAGVRCQTMCSDGDVRLVNGRYVAEGRVEICAGGSVWGTACDRSWDRNAVRVVCRQLGLPEERVTAIGMADFGEGTGPIVFDNIGCRGTEADLFDCLLSSSMSCTHLEDAGARCLPPPPDDLGTPVFLPYGVSHQDSVETVGDDVTFTIPAFDVAIPFFSTVHYQEELHVSSNGLITFRIPFANSRNQDFTDRFTLFQDAIIAPLWTNLNLAGPARLFYRVSRVLSDLTAVADLIANRTMDRSYVPSLVVVVTWENVPVVNNQSAHTFQVVIATDNRTAFAVFNYADVRAAVRADPTIGFYGNRLQLINVDMMSLESTNVFRIDGNCITKAGLIEMCPLSSVSFECSPRSLNATLCQCDQGFELPAPDAPLCDIQFGIPLLPQCLDFFPFGERNGDTRLPQSIDEVVGPINMTVPVVFFQQKQYKYYVSTNGFVSFASPPETLGMSSLLDSTVPLVAPLRTDFDLRDVGFVYHRVTQDDFILDLAARKIASTNVNFATYRPTSCIIATWSQAVLFSGSFRNAQIAVQVVLATDGQTSFAIFNYEDQVLIGRILDQSEGTIGFSSGNPRTSIILDQSSPSLVHRIDGNCITTSSCEDACELNSTSLDCNSLSARTCICNEGFTGQRTCHLSDFFPFGVVHGDTVGSQEIDETSEALSLEVPVVFNLKEHQNVYVSSNGLILFDDVDDDEFESHAVITCLPRQSQPFFPFLAPLWTDFNFRDFGSMFYRATTDSDTLEDIAQAISNLNSNYRNFQPTLAVIVTWLQSRPLRNSDEVTFQATIATDGKISFLLAIYDTSLDSLEDNGIAFRIGADGGDGLLISARNREPPSADTFFGYRIDGKCQNEISEDGCGLDSIPFRCPTMTDTSDDDCRFSFNHNLRRCSCQFSSELLSDTGNCLGYFPHGERAGDTRLPEIGSIPRRSYALVNLSVPLVFYGNIHSTLNISTDGSISLSTLAATNFTQIPLPTPNTSPIIAPLWMSTANLLLTLRNTLDYRVTSDPETLSLVADFLAANNSELDDFQPTEAIIATVFLNAESEYTSVQYILATDGATSFAVFLYEGIDNSGQQRPVDYQIGFDAGDQSNSAVIQSVGKLLLDTSVAIYRIDGECITSTSPRDACDLTSAAVECSGLVATLCECRLGYRSAGPLICEDIDECEEESPCSDLANCINSPGSYSCSSCFEGYTGDGITCSDVDECSLIPSPCSVNANCTNTEPSFVCQCNGGFEGNGFNCTDIDECEEDPCDVNANCTNTVGSFLCTCNVGYEGNGMVCQRTGTSSETTIAIAASVAGSVFLLLLLLVLALLLIIVFKFRSSKRRNSIQLKNSESNEYAFAMDLRQLTVQTSLTEKLPKSLIVHSSNLELGKSVGQGEFGIVYKGSLKKSFTDSMAQTVAVKTLKGFVHKDLVESLLQECAKMSTFDHPNILTLSGVCLDGGPAPYIVMPFMANGSLLAYLKEERENLVLESDTSSNKAEVQKKLMDFCIQVGKGMEYLASERVIHRDLAARNCMIDINFVIKVADFGLSESLDTTKNYFRQDQDNTIKLPVKWLAPESVNDGVFSEKSDVWAYGVTCWEVFNGGKTPYPGIHPKNLPRQLDTGYRMERPLNAACSEEIYSMMLSCWKKQAEDRPTFTELVELLSSQLLSMAEYLDFTTSNQSEES